MTSSSRNRICTSRVIRPGATPQEEPQPAPSTPGERMEAVWTLTLACLAWKKEFDGEPRLQRSVVRIQRPAR